ncbi:disulfide bond formation protein B [Halorientalis sp. IM1011]|uniref:disulfide bond formation protein B n=1 Tax=Halorientalis sp. IM1011 TaxID=1932360 RepID=UPI00097CC736|nr:disulfide bond formation protein B [Halorientalis sp. IM1011]AQL42616.1 disulfide bond formation protein B [Halorientalis sp. IM1011]
MPDRPGPATWLIAGTLVAAVATAGSLFFSLGLGLVPCDLCWYQRILMYPLVVVLGVATVELRPAVWKTALPLSLGGLALASYHSVLQVTSSSCAFGGACAAIQWRLPVLGLTIPNLSVLGFALVAITVVAASGLVGGGAGD